jgi:hypothetical protein
MNYCAYLFTLFRRIYGTFLLFLHQKTYFMKKMMLYLCVFVFLITLGCSKDVPNIVPNGSTCNEVKYASAGFMVAERDYFSRPTWVLFDTDTIATTDLTLTAYETTSKYEWEFGGNKINSQTINVKLPSNAVSGDVFTFKLTVKKDWSGTCYSKGDTNPVLLVRNIVYLKDSCLIDNSSFKGYCLDNPTDIFTMTFRRGEDSTIFHSPRYFITNLIRGQTGYSSSSNSYRQKSITCNSDCCTGLNNAEGFAVLDKNDNIKFDFTHSKSQGSLEKVSRTFIGKKVR